MNYMMELEINSQGILIENLINEYIKNYCVLINIPIDIKRINIVASGSSYNAGFFGKYFFENISKTPTSVDFASEVANGTFQNFEKDTLFIFISQSGKSTDTLEALKKVKNSGAKTFVITNNENSPMHELGDYKFNIKAGLEHAIAATKTFSLSVVSLWMIALKIAQNKHIDISNETKDIRLISKEIENTLSKTENLDFATKLISKQKSLSIIGFNYHYPLSKEAALKIKETCFINTSSYPMGEFMHGHCAVLNKANTFLTFITKDCKKEELQILKRIKGTYKTKSIVVSDVYEDYDCDVLVKFPQCSTKIASIISMIIISQLIALKTALRLRRNVDKPKGLNKVVENKE